MSSILWGGRFSNHTIEFHTDNLALVSVIDKCLSRNPHITSLVRALVKSVLRFNFVFYAIYIPGVQNALADALSRDQIGLFRSLCHLPLGCSMLKYGTISSASPGQFSRLPQICRSYHSRRFCFSHRYIRGAWLLVLFFRRISHFLPT